jgi:hypothetical protein
MNRALWVLSSTILIVSVGLARSPRLNITLTSGEIFRNVIIESVSESTITVSRRDTAMRFPLESVALMERRGLSSTLKGATIGLVAGGATGYLAGSIIRGINEKEEGNVWTGYRSSISDNDTDLRVVLPIVGGCVGAIIGGFVGSSSEVPDLDMTGRTMEEKRGLIPEWLLHQ